MIIISTGWQEAREQSDNHINCCGNSILGLSNTEYITNVKHYASKSTQKQTTR